MPDKAKGTRCDDTEACRIDYLHVPVLTQGADDPPADGIGGEKDHKHHRGKNGNKRTMQEQHLNRGADQHGRVQRDHPAEARFVNFGGAAPNHVALVALGDAQFHEPKQRYGHK